MRDGTRKDAKRVREIDQPDNRGAGFCREKVIIRTRFKSTTY